MDKLIVLVAESDEFIGFLFLALFLLLGLFAVLDYYIVDIFFYLFFQLLLIQKHVLLAYIFLLGHRLFLLNTRHVVHYLLVQNLFELIAQLVDVVDLHCFGQLQFLLAVDLLLLFDLLLPHALDRREEILELFVLPEYLCDSRSLLPFLLLGRFELDKLFFGHLLVEFA